MEETLVIKINLYFNPLADPTSEIFHKYFSKYFLDIYSYSTMIKFVAKKLAVLMFWIKCTVV